MQNDPIGGDSKLSSLTKNSWNNMRTNILSLGGKKGLFNGNIAWMMTDNWFFDYTTYVPYSGVISHAYKYDQLHRIKAAHSYFSSDGMNVTADNSSNGYHENFNYDRNGNITSLQRRHKGAGLIDNLIYNYNHSTQVNTLSTIQDLSNNPNITNIQNQEYTYNAIGNLITDETNNIIWDSYNKIKNVEYSHGDIDNYCYDPLGYKAVTKKMQISERGYIVNSSIYIRDPKGKQLAIYKSRNDDGQIEPAKVEEYTIYGSDQIGTRYMDAPARLYPPLVKSRHRVHYHLKNHLGNILSTITDRRVGYYDVATQEFHHYEPEQYDSRDYYAFGSESRSCENPWVPKHTTKQGFNNKEKSHKTNSQTNYDYGFRIYNAGIGKFLSVDPLTKKFPWWTPYQFAGNMPIKYIDLDGLEPARNPDSPGSQYGASWAPNKAFNATGGLETYNSTTPVMNDLLEYVSFPNKQGEYRSESPDAFQFNLFVNANKEHRIKDDSKFSEKQIVNYVMGNFIFGTGPENLVFPTNGKFSTMLKESSIFEKALNNFRNSGRTTNNVSFNIVDMGREI